MKKVCTCLAMTLQWQSDRFNATFSARHIFDKLLSYKLLASNFRSSMYVFKWPIGVSGRLWPRTKHKLFFCWKLFRSSRDFSIFWVKTKTEKCFTNCLVEKVLTHTVVSAKALTVDPLNVGAWEFWQNIIKTVEHRLFHHRMDFTSTDTFLV